MRRAAVEDLVEAVAAVTGVPESELLGPGRRKADALLAREGLVWLLVHARGMYETQAADAIAVSFRTVDATINRLRQESDTRGGRKVAVDAGAWLMVRGIDGSPNRPSPNRAAELCAVLAQEHEGSVRRAGRHGAAWSIGRKAWMLALLRSCDLSQAETAHTMGCQRSSVQECLRRCIDAPSESDKAAIRVAESVDEALHRERLAHALRRAS
ncbi:MAG: hypothetical protein KF684_04225 [Phycisphaeraceae bacterium]|nr:hypothetical protein [Phycisphaeraceae bacterium]